MTDHYPTAAIALTAQGKATSFWGRLALVLFGGHAPCPRCHLRVQLNGARDLTAAEDLIKRLAGGRHSVPFHLLEQRLAEVLCDREQREGAWMLDIGGWGLSVYRNEAAHMLTALRPEFAILVPGEVPPAISNRQADVSAISERERKWFHLNRNSR